MVNMDVPQVPEEHPPVIAEDDLRLLLKACEGTTFEDRVTWPWSGCSWIQGPGGLS